MTDGSTLSPHRVRRLRWQARAPSAAEAFALRSLLREGSEAVHTALEQACSAVMREGADADEVWHVPRLLLRITAADLGRLEAELPGRVALALRDALAAAGVGQSAAISAAAAVSAASSTLSAANGERSLASASSSTAHERAGLQHYLASGGLSWALAGLAADAVQPVLQRAAVQALHALWAGELRLDQLLPAPADAIGALDSRIGALLRWLQLLPAALRQRWLASSPAPAGIDATLGEAWQARIGGAETADSLEWLALWLAWAALPQPITSLPTQSADRTAAAPALRDWLNRQLALSTQPALSSALLNALGQAPAPSNASAHPPAPAEPMIGPSINADIALPLLVPLAGLVLLHPFLPRFLAGCGVLDATGRSIADAQLPRACALLHALASGDADAFEHQLPLVKLLLGRAPDAPLAAALPRLGQADQAEVAALLDAVREHWTGLRGTGALGLRLSFLQRRGLLRRLEGSGGTWQLTLQSEAFDLLIGLLPWSISLVKLPWMPQPLMVEWSSSP